MLQYNLIATVQYRLMLANNLSNLRSEKSTNIGWNSLNEAHRRQLTFIVDPVYFEVSVLLT